MDIQWDQAKARSNYAKHGITFADAVGALHDPQALTLEDPDAEGEQRFITMGLDFLGRSVVVVYTYRNDSIRIISARKATKKEVKIYERRV